MKHIIYYVCKYTPVELLEAFDGTQCVRLEPQADNFDCAEACAHPNLCGYGKGVIEAVTAAKPEALVLTDCCDVMRRVYDVLEKQNFIPFLYFLPLPHLVRKRDEVLFAEELEGLRKAWTDYLQKSSSSEAGTANLTGDAGAAAAAEFGNAGGSVASGDEDAVGNPYGGENPDQRLLVTWRNRASEAAKEKEAQAGHPHISLCGAHAGASLAVETQSLFSVPVTDETCTGIRRLPEPEDSLHFPENPKNSDSSTRQTEAEGSHSPSDILNAYAAALLQQENPCMRMQERPERTLSENCKGVIYHTVKFCDYYGFSYRTLREKAEVPILKIESDCTPTGAGQLQTRLEAFAETLHLEPEASAATASAGGRNLTVTQTEETASRGASGQPAAEEFGIGGAENWTVRSGVQPFQTGNAVGQKGLGSAMKTGYFAGVDSGSTSTDAVVMDRDGKILGTAILPTGMSAKGGAEKALEEALAQTGIRRDQIENLVMTGYGRAHIGLDGKSVTEITCHARGAHFLYPESRTVIDIGGQDSKAIAVDEEGNVTNFVMNDKCAAGTGRFLDMMASALGMTLDEMSRKGLEWKKQVRISSMCTVFAESEVVSLVAEDVAPADIIHGLNTAIAGKTVSLVKRVGGSPAYIMTGGVSRNPGLVKALEEKLGASVYVPEYAQLCGAIGAALIARGA